MMAVLISQLGSSHLSVMLMPLPWSLDAASLIWRIVRGIKGPTLGYQGDNSDSYMGEAINVVD